MDRLVDEAEGLADTTSSVCSVGASGRLEPSAEQQLGLLNSITASDLTGELLIHEPQLLSLLKMVVALLNLKLIAVQLPLWYKASGVS